MKIIKLGKLPGNEIVRCATSHKVTIMTPERIALLKTTAVMVGFTVFCVLVFFFPMIIFPIIVCILIISFFCGVSFVVYNIFLDIENNRKHL